MFQCTFTCSQYLSFIDFLMLTMVMIHEIENQVIIHVSLYDLIINHLHETLQFLYE